MPSDEKSSSSALIEALETYDASTRQERAERIRWVGQHSALPSVVMGRTETMHLLNQAREVFVNGHFAAALFFAVAVVEHSLMEECQQRGLLKGSPPLGELLKIAKEHGVVSNATFVELQLMVFRRNPYAHLKEPAHEHGLGYRIRDEQRHPALILRQDAEMAIKLMYQVFRSTLRATHL